MADDRSLAVPDREGTPARAAPEARDSRSSFLRRAAIAGGALAAGGGLAAGVPNLASSARVRRRDARILNFLPLLEYLQADFYAKAASERALTGELRTFAETVGEHERAHVAALRNRIGRGARAKPTFDFGNATGRARFATTALELEELTMSAYIGQGANLSSRGVKVAISIVSVEARHVAWMRDFLRKHPAPRSADPAMGGKRVLAAIEKLGFIRGSA